ncbi:MAG: hypothetical protein AB8G16_00130 [Gammaproteobacteria bacterium]
MYPFVPKTTKYLRPGQFWDIPLTNGLYACGRVLQLKYENGSRNTRQFLAALMDWCGAEPPSTDELAGAGILASGQTHVKTIAHSGSEILGLRELEADKIHIPLSLDAAGGQHCRVRRGFELLAPATQKQLNSLPIFQTWGYNVIVIRAEAKFGGAAKQGVAANVWR